MEQRRIFQRYAPFLAILGMLALLMVMEPDGTPSEEESLLSSGVGGSTDASGAGSTGIGGTTSDAGVIDGTSGSATAGGTIDSGTGATGGTGTGSVGGGGTSASGQRVDGLGRPLEGDKSKCAPGGLLQENVTSFSLPCIPKFTGDNGGATYQGVTNDEVKVVLLVPHYEPAVQTALQGVGLAATDQQHDEAAGVHVQFINKRFELYNRKLKHVLVTTDCQPGDNPCYRADAKAAVAKHKPFAVIWYVPGIMPEAFADEISRQKVLALGPPGFNQEWFVNRRPYVWTEVGPAPRNVDSVADYYCKKMVGKNATLAGDPQMRIKKRKLGIFTSEFPDYVAFGQHMKRQVTGGMCGSPADDVKTYTVSANADQAEAQMPTLIARMKNDGITTLLGLPGPNTLGCTECDKQQWYPEHFIAGMTQTDADIVGRLDASTQRQNRFGIGWRPLGSPLNEHDFRKAYHDINPNADPEYLTEGPWLGLAMIGRFIQLAGPRLTPQTVEQGAHTMPILGGYSNPNPWPGYKCCNPHVPKWYFGGANNFAAWWDVREIYWSDSAISPDDGRPGAWICVNQCKRFEPGGAPKGEPKVDS